ncbi:uncharacterized protein [Montipora foliosa]|uniref:uncharacterized protein n=1 Tax=Montipora foliosa TaxID=591990 RepID=UPI0035F1CA52
MKLTSSTVVYAVIFGATICIFTEVETSEVYCFSCFGFTAEKPWLSKGAKSTGKCEDRDGGNLMVRKCTQNPSDKPICVRFRGKYKLPQMIGDQLEERFFEAAGLHCATTQQCNKKECPNYWTKDVREISDCEMVCCGSHESQNCTFPVPRTDEIRKTYKATQAEEDNKLDVAVAGERSSGANTVEWPVWTQAMSFVFFEMGRRIVICR